MPFATADLVVDGILCGASSFETEDELDAWVDQMIQNGADNQLTEVFVIWHEHDEGAECECVQYLTSHHPYKKKEATNSGDCRDFD